MIDIAGLSRSFGGNVVIDKLSLTVREDEKLAILGPNGAGKTTLLRLIAGEIAPDSGRIFLQGQDVTGLGADARACAGIGRGFQHTSLFEAFTLKENLILSAMAARAGGYGPGRDPLKSPALNRFADDAAALVGLDGLDRPVASVDYGTRRRLDLAMALAGDPRVLVLDEPASGIGPGGSAELHHMISGLPARLSLIVVEHDLDLAFAIADRIVILDRGQIRFDGPPAGARPALKAIYDA